MAIVTQTTHGSETRTVNEPFHASVNSSATVYSSDGTTATGYGSSTINGNQTRTIIIPTETTITRNSVQLYMFTYRVKEDDVVLIATDKVLYQRVSAAGSGNNAAGAEIGAGIGNIIRASHDAHRADKLYREALDAIIADQISSPSAPPERVQAPVQPSTLIARPISANDISKLRFTSLPENAEIVIDGAFAGNAPSTITLAPGKHSIAVSAKGYQTWSRDMNVVSGSEISIRAVLDKAPNLLRFRE